MVDWLMKSIYCQYRVVIICFDTVVFCFLCRISIYDFLIVAGIIVRANNYATNKFFSFCQQMFWLLVIVICRKVLFLYKNTLG